MNEIWYGTIVFLPLPSCLVVTYAENQGIKKSIVPNSRKFGILFYSHGAENQPTALSGYSGKSSNNIFLPIKKPYF
jgi:hypothetical protein